MSGIRVLVGTQKGAFILSADGNRQNWQVSGPHFGGWEIFHVKGSLVDPNRIYLSQFTEWFRQTIQRSDDGGVTWEQVAMSSPTTGIPAPISGTTARPIPGSSSVSGISNHPLPTRILSTLGLKTPLCSSRTTLERPGKSWPACAATIQGQNGSRAPAACVCTRSFLIRPIPDGYSPPFRLPARSDPKTPA